MLIFVFYLRFDPPGTALFNTYFTYGFCLYSWGSDLSSHTVILMRKNTKKYQNTE